MTVTNLLARGLLGFGIGIGASMMFLATRLRRESSALAASVAAIVGGCLVCREFAQFDRNLPALAIVDLVFAAIILVLALLERRLTRMARRLAWLGDASYAIYLWHFPLQLVFVLAMLGSGATSAVFYRPETMAAFFVLIVPLALASHYLFERPMQRFIRARLARGSRIPQKGTGSGFPVLRRSR